MSGADPSSSKKAAARCVWRHALARRQLADKLKIPYAYFERNARRPASLLDRT
jgi:Mn-dependent DtxR family transcriptional regulator